MERDTPGGPVKWITKQTDKVSDVSRIGNTKKRVVCCCDCTFNHSYKKGEEELENNNSIRRLLDKGVWIFKGFIH